MATRWPSAPRYGWRSVDELAVLADGHDGGDFAAVAALGGQRDLVAVDGCDRRWFAELGGPVGAGDAEVGAEGEARAVG